MARRFPRFQEILHAGMELKRRAQEESRSQPQYQHLQPTISATGPPTIPYTFHFNQCNIVYEEKVVERSVEKPDATATQSEAASMDGERTLNGFYIDPSKPWQQLSVDYLHHRQKDGVGITTAAQRWLDSKKDPKLKTVSGFISRARRHPGSEGSS